MKNFSLRLACAVLCCCTATLSAQWHGDGTQASENCLQFQGLPHIPELHTDMPLDCLIGYIAMDSIARNVGVFEATRYPANAVIPQLRIFARYIYAMADYDPILLHRHFFSTRDSSYPNGQYRSYPANAYYPVMLAIYDRQKEFGQKYGMLVAAAYVLRVRVIDVREGIDSTLHTRPFLNANVACEVLEIFKGHRLPQNCNIPPQDTKLEKTLNRSNCLIYGYTPNDRERRTQPGDDMFIVLDLGPETRGLYSIRPEGGFNKTLRGRFLIRDGRVEDPDNVFGLGINPTVEDFRSTLLTKIADIYSWKQ